MHVCDLVRLLISGEISQSCKKLHLFLKLTRAVTEDAHYGLKAHLQFSCSFTQKRHSSFDLPLFLPLNMCGHARAGEEGNPHSQHRKSPHPGRKLIFSCGLARSYRVVSVRMCPAVPEHGWGRGAWGATRQDKTMA